MYRPIFEFELHSSPANLLLPLFQFKISIVRFFAPQFFPRTARGIFNARVPLRIGQSERGWFRIKWKIAVARTEIQTGTEIISMKAGICIQRKGGGSKGGRGSRQSRRYDIGRSSKYGEIVGGGGGQSGMARVISRTLSIPILQGIYLWDISRRIPFGSLHSCFMTFKVFFPPFFLFCLV